MKALLRKIVVAAFLSLSVQSFAAEAMKPQSPVADPGYLLVLGRSLDRAKIMAYSAVLPAVYAETGGRYIGLGRATAGVTCLYGLCDGRSAVIARWDDYRNVAAFWCGDSYRKAVRLRDAAGAFTIVGLRGMQGVTPFEPSGALLVATSALAAPSQQAWLDAAVKSGARLLVPFTPDAVVPLEGDALYNRVALLSFDSPASRAGFVDSAATKDFLKFAASAPIGTLISLIAVDAPPTVAGPATK